MKLIDCPLNGPRNAQEFVCGGEVVPMPDPNGCSDAEWTDYLFMENNTAGIVREWWCHVPTAYWFIAERDTVRDQFVRTYASTEIFGERRDFAKPAEAEQ